ncbi:hypothetical protein N7478_008238 [Penicillium angulare]|uniref:uncharacterized protein n=1 Tax=Penicillium angulare TaxID=116970 RepID=UPI00253FE163|nr:uncharacterized protein N7478_008238 [Penicillium angulare]KAJ5273113.1 hypothetical protein N7478_008238 [Penicillium angulare]
MARPDLKRIFPEVTAFIAFILTLLCLFAGTQRNLLDNADILTLYTPQTDLASNASTFYSIHVMSYCQGTIGSMESGMPGSARNVTSCSDRNILFSFDPTEAWPEEETNGTSLTWPRVISDDFHAFRLTTQSMAVLYCIGLAAIGAVLLVRVSSFLAPRSQYGIFEFGFLVLASLSMNIASIITTVIAFEFVALINAHGHGLDVSARYGEKFLGMTWAAAGLLLVGSIASFVNVFVRETRAEAPPPSKDEEDLEG